MNWLLLFLMSIFALQCSANEETSDIVKSTILRQNLSDRNLRLDPLLRKALLKALVELEKEAEEKLKAEETRSVRSEDNNEIGNFLPKEENKQEIQGPEETTYTGILKNDAKIENQPILEESRDNAQEVTSSIDNTKIESEFQYSTTPPSIRDVSNLIEESKNQDAVIQSSIETNFIPNETSKEKNIGEESEDLNKESKKLEENKETKAADENSNDVDIFKAPLVAAFTLHQDSKGTPHSVIPLFSKEQEVNRQRQQMLEQQYALYKQQHQQQQQFLQNQFIPSVALTPVPQLNQFDQSTRYFLATGSPTFSPSTVYPPLVSNSIIPQAFTPVPTQSFDATTLSPFKTDHQNFLATLPPQRNFSPQPFSQSLLPPAEFSVIQAHSINLTPATSQNFALPTVTPAPRLQPLNIPPVTLPLQNEARFQSPIIIPSIQPNSKQAFMSSQEQERIRNRLLEEQNRNRLIEEQNRQRQIHEQNRQRLLEEERQRQLYEAHFRLRQQRQEHGVEFQRSVGFTFNPNIQSNLRPTSFKNSQKTFNFHIQPSHNFLTPVNFLNPSHLRVNRQEEFGSTGNFGFSNNQGTRNYDNNHYQYQTNHLFTRLPEYRTIPDEHYQNFPITPYHQTNRYTQSSQQNQQFNRAEDVNKRLQNLLFQSGVASGASGQEDLNIVSKVLALNHERSDSNASETVFRNEGISQAPKKSDVNNSKENQRTSE